MFGEHVFWMNIFVRSMPAGCAEACRSNRFIARANVYSRVDVTVGRRDILHPVAHCIFTRRDRSCRQV